MTQSDRPGPGAEINAIFANAAKDAHAKTLRADGDRHICKCGGNCGANCSCRAAHSHDEPARKTK